MAESSRKQLKIILFKTLTENSCKDFSDFWLDVSSDDSLPFCTNCMSSKIQVPGLWCKRLLVNQIA